MNINNVSVRGLSCYPLISQWIPSYVNVYNKINKVEQPFPHRIMDNFSLLINQHFVFDSLKRRLDTINEALMGQEKSFFTEIFFMTFLLHLYSWIVLLSYN